MSCQFRVGVPTILLQYYDARPGSPSRRDCNSGSCISTQYVPFERFMGVLKKYVHNRARPEGSISTGHQTKEVIEFCVDFIPDLKPIGVPESRHEGRLGGKGTLGSKSLICRDKISWAQAHNTVLQISSLVPRISMNTRIFYAPNTRSSLKTGLHMKTWGLSVVGCKHISWVTPLLKMSCTCCPGHHLRLY